MRRKFLLLSALFFCLAPEAMSQVNKGRYLIGGRANLYSAKSDQASPTSKSESLSANSQFGKVIRENTVIGVLLSYSYFKNRSGINNPDVKNIQYSTGIFYRKYKKLLTNLYLFGEFDAAYFHQDNKQAYYQNPGDLLEVINKGVSVSFIPGISYAIWKRLQVELLMPDLVNLSYSNATTKYTNTVTPFTSTAKGHTFFFNSNLNSSLLSSFGVGFKFILGR